MSRFAAMSRDEFIVRIAAAILAGQSKSGDPADPASAAAYAAHVAGKLPGLFRAGIYKIAAEFGPVRRG
jgi:hypothetical protein